jgi:hypothetical protein
MAKPIRWGVLIALTAIVGIRAQADRPLPDQTGLLRAVKSNLQGDRLHQRRYTYREKRTDVKRDDNGMVVSRSVKVFEVFPPVKGTDADRRLVAVDGVPRGAGERAAEADRQRQTALLERLRQLRNETPAQREKRLREEAEDQRKENDIVDDAFRVYRFHLEGHETLDGRETIMFTFNPDLGVMPLTSEGKLLQKFAGRAWIDEHDRQMMRLEVESTDDVAFGLGILARLHKGSQIVFQRRPVMDTTAPTAPLWLPSELRYSGGGRLLLVKKLRVEGIREYSDYKPVGAEQEFSASGRTSGN